MKRCYSCGVEKDETEFHKNRAQGNGLSTQCAVCSRARSRLWGLKNRNRRPVKQTPEQIAAYKKAWADRNKIAVLSRAAKWQKDNKERASKTKSKWAKRNRKYTAFKCAERRSQKMSATPSWANEFFIEEAYDLAARRSALKCGGHAKWHVDHIVPLKSDLVCGLHVHNNLQVVPALHNWSKNNRYWPDMP